MFLVEKLRNYSELHIPYKTCIITPAKSTTDNCSKNQLHLIYKA